MLVVLRAWMFTVLSVAAAALPAANTVRRGACYAIGHRDKNHRRDASYSGR